MRRVVLALLALAALRLDAQQMADTSFHPVVAKPAYSSGGPRVAIDQAHVNFHTASGRYAPFADLLRLDGYRVDSNTVPFDDASLRGIAVLVVANARATNGPDAGDRSAFSPAEIAAVKRWVESGGALLLIADHAPYGGASDELSRAFGVEMGKGVTQDTALRRTGENPTFLRFTAENKLLGEHPIIAGRSASERVRVVATFTGQSLTVPRGAEALLKLAPSAVDRAPPSQQQTAARSQRLDRLRDSIMAALAGRGGGDTVIALRTQVPAAERVSPQLTPAGGRAQGVALGVGKGRVVILGEAAFLSAQVVEIPGSPPTRMGMNVPGSDDQQFCLNMLHWLSRILD